MKRIFLLSITFFLIACNEQKDDFVNSFDFNERINHSANSKLLLENQFLALPKADKAIIRNYCNDLKTLAFATNAINAKALDYNSYKEVPIEEIQNNPMIVNLQFLDIRNAKTDKSICFYDLPLKFREKFLNDYLKEEQKSLEQKAALMPELLEDLKKYDLACEKVFSSNGIRRLDYDKEEFDKSIILKTKSSNYLTAQETKEDLFDLIEAELDSQNNQSDSENQYKNSHKIELKSSGGGGNPDLAPEVIKFYSDNEVSRGYILLRDIEWFNWGGDSSIAGHTGIFNQSPDSLNKKPNKATLKASIDSTPEDKKEGYSDGVQERILKTWCRPHYILGIYEVVTYVKLYSYIHGEIDFPEEFLSGIDYDLPEDLFYFQTFRKYSPIKDLSKMADRAGTYIGKPYGSVFNSMEEAPNKFICSSLVWYCAKMEYGIDLSNGSKRSVWPKDILTDSNVYIKASYKK